MHVSPVLQAGADSASLPGAVERAVATHEQCRLSMKSLLGDNVSPKLLQKLEEAPDEHTLRYHHPLLHNTY